MLFLLLALVFTFPSTNGHELFEEFEPKIQTTAENYENVANNQVPNNLLLKMPFSGEQPQKDYCQNPELILQLLDILLVLIKDSSKGEKLNNVLSILNHYFAEAPHKKDQLYLKMKLIQDQILQQHGLPSNIFGDDISNSDNQKTTIVFSQIPGISHPTCKEEFSKLMQIAYNAYSDLAKSPTCQANNLYPHWSQYFQKLFGAPQKPYQFDIFFQNKSPNQNGFYQIPSNGVFNQFHNSYPFINNLNNPNTFLYQNIFKAKNKPSDLWSVNNPGFVDYGSFNNGPQNKVPFKPHLEPNYGAYTINNQPNRPESPVFPGPYSKPYEGHNDAPSVMHVYGDHVYGDFPNTDVVVQFANKSEYSPYTPNSSYGAQVIQTVLPEENQNQFKVPKSNEDLSVLINQLGIKNKPQYLNRQVFGQFNENSNQVNYIPNLSFENKPQTLPMQNGNEFIFNQENGQTDSYNPFVATSQEHYFHGYKNPSTGYEVPYKSQFEPSKETNSNLPLKNIEYDSVHKTYDTKYPNSGSFPFQYSNVNVNPNSQPYDLGYDKNLQYQNGYENLDLNNGNQNGDFGSLEGNNKLSPSLQQLLSMANQNKLPTSSGKSGQVELTYVLKRPKPLVYQPVYYVKYRLPYRTFVHNYKDLVSKKPSLRLQPEKLYQELIHLSNVTHMSPELQQYNKKEIIKLVFDKGALVEAKVVHGKDKHLNEQLEVVRNLNSNLKPEDIDKIAARVNVNKNASVIGESNTYNSLKQNAYVPTEEENVKVSPEIDPNSNGFPTSVIPLNKEVS